MGLFLRVDYFVLATEQPLLNEYIGLILRSMTDR